MTMIALRSLAAAEALEVILTHEKITFERAVGPGFKVLLVEASRSEILDKLGQWNMALHVAREAVLDSTDIIKRS